jgi:prepilin-type N-terminal cleavage/methylation domain-containing protein
MKRSRRGLTLLEVLVVLGVVALIIALSLTGLRVVNERAKHAQLLADLRGGVGMFATWSNDRQGQNLHYELDPRKFSARCGPGFDGEQVCVAWFEQAINRRWALSWLWTTGERPEVWSYSYAVTSLADPRLWNKNAQPSASEYNAYMRPTFTQEVSFPAQKVLLNGSWRGERGVLLGFFDGSAAVIPWKSVVQQVRGPMSSGRSQYDEPGSGTPDGLRGIDVQR